MSAKDCRCSKEPPARSGGADKQSRMHGEEGVRRQEQGSLQEGLQRLGRAKQPGGCSQGGYRFQKHCSSQQLY